MSNKKRTNATARGAVTPGLTESIASIASKGENDEQIRRN